MSLVRVAIGLGGNLGDRRENLARAARELGREAVSGARSSSVYESPPWGITEQPDFLNAVISGATRLSPPDLLARLKSIEVAMGRTVGVRNGPRVIDLDLIAYAEQRYESPGIEVPHPRMSSRDFVLLPLVEVWPDWRHPVLGKTARELLTDLEGSGPTGARVIGPPLLDKASP